MDIDNEKLIKAVCEKKPLWNKIDKRYYSRDIQRRNWAKVAEEIGVSNVEEVKKKWKGLRDTFRRNYKKIYNSTEEEHKELSSSMPFFNQMKFLSGVVESRILKGNITYPQRVASSSGKDSSRNVKNVSALPLLEYHFSTASQLTNIDAMNQQKRSSPPEPPKMSPLTTETIHHKRERFSDSKLDNCNKNNHKKEEKKIRLSAESKDLKDNSDCQFLLSLLPYMKKVTCNRKLIVRNKIQQVFIDEDELHYTSTQTLSSYTPYPSSGYSSSPST
ncbi:uncharacterized protein LOC142317530 [Lycorma delicatula]|uniref:uncharacterized protein LOC142317530 n=1 Tax=Lycorma delicatula TaxID=130591 RepID=UPI003F51A901